MARKKTDSGQNGLLLQGEVPKVPEGYYSPGPNPRLRELAILFSTPYDPTTDDYNVAPFDQPVIDRSPTPAYDMHMYWAKKPHGGIASYIEHFTNPGDLVLDPMCGSGGAGSVAVTRGRKAILIDLSPAATFIAKHLVTPVNPRGLENAFAELNRLVAPDMEWLYETKCERCGGAASTAFVVHSQVYKCIKCLNNVPLYDCLDGRLCPHCHNRITTRQSRLGYMPVEVSYSCLNGCTPQRERRKYNDPDMRKAEFFREYDAPKLNEINSRQIPYWYPTDPFPTEWVSWRPNLAEAGDVSGFFTKRNLWAAASLVDAIGKTSDESLRSWLMFTFTATLLNISKKAQHLEEGGGYIPGNYTFPPMIKERNALASYQSVAKKVLNGTRYITENSRSQSVVISTQSALSMTEIPTSSVDYIFTDPPYSNKVPFGEFNFLWEVWLRRGLSWTQDEVIVNERIGKGFDTWKTMMVSFLEECYRVLKPGRWMSVCYHDSAEGSWGLLQDALDEVGFIPDRLGKVLSMERDLKSYKQRTTENVQMRDLVINFRKPRATEVSSYLDLTIGESDDEQSFRDKVLTIIRGHLDKHPGDSRDRIYDEVVSRMVRLGQMQAHNFDELLQQVAEPASVEGSTNGKRWYLKETEITKLDAAESAKEDASAASVRKFMSRWLRENPGFEGVHYSDIFEHYVYTVKDKPRRALADWLLDYLYKTDTGTYRLPESDEEERIKSEARASGASRRIKHYIAHLQQGMAILDRDRPSDATLAEWIRHCKRSGLYEQGKLLYEKGGLNLDNLSEEAMVNVEEDYQVCTRMLARIGTAKPRSGRS